MVKGDSVTYSGQAARDAAALMRLGMTQLRAQAERSGMAVPGRYELALHAATVAAETTADMRTSSDVRESPTSASSVVGDVVGVDEAARLFGVGTRQARRIVEQAGGTKTTKGWRIGRDALQAEYELRECA